MSAPPEEEGAGEILHLWKMAPAEASRADFKLGSPLRHLSCAHFHSLALMEDGRVLSWGRGSLGILGHGGEEDVSTPKSIKSLGKRCKEVSAGPYHSAVLTEDGTVHTFGWCFTVSSDGIVDQSYQLQPEPVIGFPRGIQIAGVACGCYATAAWPGAGQIFTWGKGKSGQAREQHSFPHASSSSAHAALTVGARL